MVSSRLNSDVQCVARWKMYLNCVNENEHFCENNKFPAHRCLIQFSSDKVRAGSFLGRKSGTSALSSRTDLVRRMEFHGKHSCWFDKQCQVFSFYLGVFVVSLYHWKDQFTLRWSENEAFSSSLSMNANIRFPQKLFISHVAFETVIAWCEQCLGLHLWTKFSLAM